MPRERQCTGTKLPLWMLAIYLIASNSKGISAPKLAFPLGVGIGPGGTSRTASER